MPPGGLSRVLQALELNEFLSGFMNMLIVLRPGKLHPSTSAICERVQFQVDYPKLLYS